MPPAPWIRICPSAAACPAVAAGLAALLSAAVADGSDCAVGIAAASSCGSHEEDGSHEYGNDDTGVGDALSKEGGIAAGVGRRGDAPTLSKKSRPMYYAHSAPRVVHAQSDHMHYIEGEYAFGVVADLDLMSRDPQEFIWRSYLKKGRVIRMNKRNQRDRFTIAWDDELELRSSTATRNRSMELSELVRFDRMLIAFCDFSGIAYKIHPQTGKTFQRWAIADGDGNEPKPFKGEWATIKDDAIWLGSHGIEWYGKEGEILHRNAEWIKTISANGLIDNINWHPVYQTLRTATNTTLPGYLWHEAVEWEPLRRLWVMLPRFASTTHRYTPGLEHADASDLLIVADEAFMDIQVVRLGHHDPSYGVTSVKRLPGSQRLFMVLRVREENNIHHTQAAIIDLRGDFFTEPPYIEVGSRKFEGLAFL